MTFRGPLAGRYPVVATMVILFLVPFLGLSSALGPIDPIIAHQLHMSLLSVNLASGMANAGYAVGTVVAVQLAQLLPQRRMLLVYAALLVIGSVMAAAAPDAGVFIAGHVLQGFCTSLLLIAAVPPLAIGYPADKMRWTAVVMNVCIFGAVAAGPLIGGAAASADAWRPLFWIVAGIAAVAFVLSVLTFSDVPPADRSAPRDGMAIGLAAVGCVAAFWGSSELTTHRFLAAPTALPLLGGLALIGILFIHQYRGKHSLLTVRSLASTLPAAGMVAAICAAAASVSATALSMSVLESRYSPLHLGMLYLPELGGAAVSAALFGVVFRSRWIHYFTLAGMGFLAVGILCIGAVASPTQTLVLVGSGLIGLGVGASVTPALFIAGFSLRSSSMQRVFAFVEQTRAIAAFMAAPILAHFALTSWGGANAGIKTALWICFGLSVGGALVGVALYALGGERPPTPDIDAFLAGTTPAWDSKPLLARVRKDSADREGPGTNPPSFESSVPMDTKERVTVSP
jgi:MFS family permease